MIAKRKNTRQAQGGVVADVRAQSVQAAELASIEGQERLADPRTNPAVRGRYDRLRDEQQQVVLDAEHARVLRKHRVVDAAAADAEATLQALALARHTVNPAHSVLALHQGRRLYGRVSMAASLALACGSAMGVEKAAHVLASAAETTVPTGTGYIAEIGLTGLSTLAILYRGHLAAHRGSLKDGDSGKYLWQHWALLALMVVPLLVSVAANVGTGNILGGACAIGAAAFGVLAFIVGDRSAAAMVDRADEVDQEAETELRVTAMGEALFSATPTQDVPAVQAPAAAEGRLSDAELLSLGADAERVRAYLEQRGVRLQVAEISPVLAAEHAAHLGRGLDTDTTSDTDADIDADAQDKRQDEWQDGEDGRWLTAAEYAERGLDIAEHGDGRFVEVEELDETTAAVRAGLDLLEEFANDGDDPDALGARVPVPGGAGPQGAARPLPGAASAAVQVSGRGALSSTQMHPQMHPPVRTEPDQGSPDPQAGRERVAAALAARRSDGDLTRYRVAELLLRLPHTTHATAAEALGVHRDTVKRVRRELRDDCGWDQMTTDQRQALVAELADRAGVQR